LNHLYDIQIQACTYEAAMLYCVYFKNL